MNEYKDEEFNEQLDEIIKEDENSFVTETIENLPEETPYWAKNIKEESMQKSLLAGNILPELRLRAGTIYTVKITSEIKPVLSAKGNFDVMDVQRNGLNMSVKCNESFKFSLEKERRLHNLKYSELIGKEIVLQKDDKGFVTVQLKI